MLIGYLFAYALSGTGSISLSVFGGRQHSLPANLKESALLLASSSAVYLSESDDFIVEQHAVGRNLEITVSESNWEGTKLNKLFLYSFPTYRLAQIKTIIRKVPTAANLNLRDQALVRATQIWISRGGGTRSYLVSVRGPHTSEKSYGKEGFRVTFTDLDTYFGGVSVTLGPDLKLKYYMKAPY